jgi:D-glycerate 3-kinase
MCAQSALWPDATVNEDAARVLQRAATQLEAWCTRKRLAPGMRAQLASVHVPLAIAIARARKQHAARPLVIGISGAQGTGKSTLAALLACVLDVGCGLRSARLSLDDLYLTRAERIELARTQHPLLRTRGVPGTHDVALGLRTIDALLTAAEGDAVRIPRFDKALDDRAPEATWPVSRGRVDVLLFEGWCLGAQPEAGQALRTPINSLERDEDVDARFRRYANAQLDGAYRALFARLELQVFLAAPEMDCVLDWRMQQEREIAASSRHATHLMSEAQLARFVQHYERITRHMLAHMPERADIVLRLARDHTVAAIELHA